jgi:hypothetical protein
MQNTAYSQTPNWIPALSAKINKGSSMKYWEIIAANLSKAGWSYGYVSVVDSETLSGLLTHLVMLLNEFLKEHRKSNNSAKISRRSRATAEAN